MIQNCYAQTQEEQVMLYLMEGKSITPIQALEKFRCFRLASIIHRLKAKGMDIITNNMTDFNTGSRYAEYHLRRIKAE